MVPPLEASSMGGSSAMQNSSLEVCLIGLAPGENAIARKSRLALTEKYSYAQQKNRES